MERKLTLRLDERLINEAKNVAKLKGTSLSKMVANYFRSISKEADKNIKYTPVLAEISGVLSQDLDKEKVAIGYKKHLEEKYL